MIQRVNFLEREIFFLTYRKMTVWGGCIAAVALLLYGSAFLQSTWVERRATKIFEEVSQLKVERDRVLSQVEEKAGAAGQGDKAVRESFERSPRWSSLLREVSHRMPAGLWLISLKTYQREDASGGRGVLLSGESDDSRQISLFLKELDGSSFFEKTLLTESKQEKRGMARVYTYTIDSGVSSSKGRGL